MSKNSTGYYFLLPSIIVLGFTSVYPAIYSFILSFYNWNWGTQQDFVGLSNYLFLLVIEILDSHKKYFFICFFCMFD